MKKVLKLCALVLMCSMSMPSAATTSPEVLVKQVTDEVIDRLTQNHSVFAADRNKLYGMVDSLILPHVDLKSMARLVLGKYWKSATTAQKTAFTSEFKGLLVRTYATALFEYNGEKIRYKPFHMKEGANRVAVKTEVVPRDGPRIPVFFSLRKTSGGEWKIYDIRLDGVSLVANYRTSYRRTIKNQGLDSLIATLSAKNKQVAK